MLERYLGPRRRRWISRLPSVSAAPRAGTWGPMPDRPTRKVAAAKRHAQRRSSSIPMRSPELRPAYSRDSELGVGETKRAAWLPDAARRPGFDARGTREICRPRSSPAPARAIFTWPFCDEYDALPEIGHACGHHLIAATAVGVAVGADVAPIWRSSIGHRQARRSSKGKARRSCRCGIFQGGHRR